MTPEQFCYWLRGIFEIQQAGLDLNEKRSIKLTEAQIAMIDDHLNSVVSATIGSPLVMPDYMSLPPLPYVNKTTLKF
jgi:hypothetical protein